MATKSSRKGTTGSKSSTSRQRATGRISERQGQKGPARVPQSEKQRSQGRFKDETPMSGERGTTKRSARGKRAMEW